MRREAFKFWDLVRLILETLRYWYVFLRMSLQWCNNGLDGVSNHQPHHSLLNHLFRCRSKKTSKLRVTGLCAGNSTVSGEFSAQMVSNAEKCIHSISLSCGDDYLSHQTGTKPNLVAKILATKYQLWWPFVHRLPKLVTSFTTCLTQGSMLVLLSHGCQQK